MFTPQFSRTDEDYARGTYTASATCMCGTVTTAQVYGEDLFQYNQGAFAQTAFPYLTSAQREALFISGICSKCWDKMFASEEE